MEEPIKNPLQPPSSEPVVTNTKKRPLENDTVSQNSRHFKLRVILRDLRPHFLEVLRTADFRNCKAANEIQEQMKLIVELYNQNATAESQTLPQEKPQSVATAEQLPPQAGGVAGPTKPADEKTHTSPEVTETGDVKGTYIIGGSAFGWNFVTFTGDDPVYYGVTKEMFRVNNPAAIVSPP